MYAFHGEVTASDNNTIMYFSFFMMRICQCWRRIFYCFEICVLYFPCIRICLLRCLYIRISFLCCLCMCFHILFHPIHLLEIELLMYTLNAEVVAPVNITTMFCLISDVICILMIRICQFWRRTILLNMNLSFMLSIHTNLSFR